MKGGRTEQDSLCCSLALLLSLLDGSDGSSRGILCGDLNSVHKPLNGNDRLRNDIAAVGPALKYVHVRKTVSKEAHLSTAEFLLVQKPTAAYWRLSQH